MLAPSCVYAYILCYYALNVKYFHQLKATKLRSHFSGTSQMGSALILGTIIPITDMNSPHRKTYRSLVIVVCGKAVLLDQFIALRTLEVFAHHLGDEFVKGDLGLPAQFLVCLGRIAQ